MRLTILFHETTFREGVTAVLHRLLPEVQNVEAIHHVDDEGVNIATYNLPWRKDPDLVVGVYPEGTPVAFTAMRAFREWQRKFPDVSEIQRTHTIPTLEETNAIQLPDPILRGIANIVVTVLYVTFSLTYRKDICELLKGYPENWLVLTDRTDGVISELLIKHAEEYNSEIADINDGVTH